MFYASRLGRFDGDGVTVPSQTKWRRMFAYRHAEAYINGAQKEPKGKTFPFGDFR